ncbi:DUF6497 family protein [Paracoccus sp. SMMA_5_TC]|uniref:DUF6497 family protein n=2 Tax=unclassified Paracoccus (in: a-proteobacteria) TaxID=2688777 RepID=UPI0012B2C773|nr:DUF6497 family protein [Paracoccus sp. SMMA_5_TC]UXU80136.1 DUF6497 family protein [Paracoccus sp. SMMA_5_TC]
MAHIAGAGPIMIAMTLTSAPLLAQDAVRVTLPSGSEVIWQETRQDNAGGAGLTYRFRFVMPDLAKRTSAAGDTALPDAPDDRGPIDIDTETAEVSGDGADTEGEALALPSQDVAIPDGQDEALFDDPATSDPLDNTQAGEVDPIHDDILWLCQNWVLPRIPNTGPRPREIVISLASRPVPFGSYDPDTLQLFEVFRLPPDKDRCEWEPW